MDFSDLKGKVCVHTGGSGVIGQAINMALGSVGVKIAILALDRTEEAAREVMGKTGCQAIGIDCSVLDRDSLEAAHEKVKNELGPVDILINSAGGNSKTATTKVEQMTPADLGKLADTFYGLELDGFDKTFDLNFKGTLLPTMVFTPDMHGRGGCVLNISSMNSYRPLTKIPAYSAAKAAINNFTQWLATHLAPMQIRVNAIAPGFFLTDQNRFLLTEEGSGDLTARGKKIIGNTPMGKFGEPEHIQGAVLYLLSEISSFVTGVIIPVDGGYSAFGGV